MKILQLGKFYPPVFGGIQNVMYELTTGLNAENISCDVLCSNDKNEYEITHYDDYKVFRTKSYGIYFSTSLSPQMISILKNIQDNYDIISIHFPDPMAALALFISRPKAKIVLHWHSDIIKQKYLLKLFEPLQNWVINRSDLIVAATENHIRGSDQVLKMLNKSIVLPYPFDANKLTKNIDTNVLNILKTKYRNKKVIFAMGRLIYYKGFEYLIQAAKYLNDDYVILIGGEGKLHENLEKDIQENKLESKVKLIGFIPYHELGTYYKFCDIFCLPSIYRSEMFGIVQLEAMSFGKPVIASNLERSGICSVNIDGVTGRCVKSESSLEIANAIIEILQDSDKYLVYSENCNKRVKEVFNKSLVIKLLIERYEKLLLNLELD